MKFILSILVLLTIAVVQASDCVVLHWEKDTKPSATTIELLADTQHPADRQEIRDWFNVKHEHGFVLSSVHTNAIAAAVVDGATVKKL